MMYLLRLLAHSLQQPSHVTAMIQTAILDALYMYLPVLNISFTCINHQLTPYIEQVKCDVRN